VPTSEADTIPPPAAGGGTTPQSPEDPAATVAAASGRGPAGLPEKLPADFGRYRLLRLLGKGGMGAVYMAHDGQLDRPVALKTPTLNASDPSLKERFFREARAAATLRHANICPVYDVGEIDGVPYLSMAYLEGRPLSDLVGAGRKPLPPRPVALMIRKLALALDEAHRHKVIHRDLKPANVMVTKQAEPILMDFGLARRGAAQEARLTQQGAIMGTPAYMAPEQARGDVEQMGPGCDIYSLGVILYELLAGRPPFQGEVMNILAQMLMDQPRPPRAYRKDADPQLSAIALKAMAKNPSDRYASMADFAAALAVYLKGAPTPAAAATQEQTSMPAPVPLTEALAVPESPPRPYPSGPPVAEKRKRPRTRLDRRPGVPGWVWGLAGAAVAVLVLVTVLVLVRPGGKPEKPSPPPAATTGTARLELSEPNAAVEVKVDGKPTALAEAVKGLTLAAGDHRLEVGGPGFQPYAAPFTVKAGESTAVPVALLRLAAPRGWTDEQVTEGKILAPDLGRLKSRFHFDYADHAAGGDGHYVMENGHYVVKDVTHFEPSIKTDADGAFEVQGRASVGSTWSVILRERSGKGGSVEVVLNTMGQFMIVAAQGPWDANRVPVATVPWTAHPAIVKGPAAFNTVLLILRERRLEVYVNQRAVCRPLTLDEDIRPVELNWRRGPQPGAGAVAEIKRVTAWPNLDGVPPAEERLLVPPLPPPPDPLSWPADALLNAQAPAPELDRTRLLEEIRSFDSRSGFGEGLRSDGSERGYRDGKLVIRSGAARTHLVALAPDRLAASGLPGDFAVAATGSAGVWGLVLTNGPGSVETSRASVLLNARTKSGLVFASSLRAAGSMSRYTPHVAVRGGPGAINTLLLVVRGGRTVEVYVNGVAACDPLVLAQELTAPTATLEILSLPGEVSEFSGVALWRADGLPTAEQRGAVRPKRPN
jgi:hypothetical protein